MKRRDLVSHLEARGCAFVREGGRHSWYRSADGKRHSTVPRHREIDEGLARKSCRDLGIVAP